MLGAALLFPHHIHADQKPAPIPDNWTPAELVWLVVAVAQNHGMTDLQTHYFERTLYCESEGFVDPAIQSGYYRHGRREPSFGIAQIDLDYHPDITQEEASDPVWAANWAADQFKKNPYQWYCYRKVLNGGSPR